MTELHIERKERSAWPWVLAGVLLLALLLWFLFGRGDGRDAAVADATVGDSVPAAAAVSEDRVTVPAVSEFVRYADAQPSTDPERAHEYTADGLRRLTDALDAVAASAAVSGVDVGDRLRAIRAQADSLQAEPTSTEHARQTREAALLAAGLMQQLQQDRFAALTGEVGEVNDAASAIQADRPLLDQTSEVQRFFERAANALQAMARPD